MTGIEDPRRIRVVLADDHPMFLSGVASLIRDTADIEVLASVGTGGRALQVIAELRPDIAVLDIAMPDMNGITVAARLSAEPHPVPAIMLSVYEDRLYVQQALSAGARGYILKRATSDNLLLAIRSVHAGGIYLDPMVASQQLATERTSPSVRDGMRRILPASLSDREEEILRFIALGYTNKEIASKLAITSKSIETYKARAAEKLGLRSRAKIVQYAVLRGWLHALA
ncbi:response regulator transcription factor [Methylorubrum salsuginis]|uniref:Two component transcriptional regulator, LuxR family n=1 Tax=Methylorubrum salsuginis TaxID=414703 RepID=A0A1I4LPH9_9HYPH|nr:response regulator transcription factor [Methylorubrum salsuginis]SFL93018.1 two component transcriptional regulator, LuxR family [Methylorubrum salsuginis]